MPSLRGNPKQRGSQKIAVCYRVNQLHRLNFNHFALDPVHKVLGLVGLWSGFSIAVDVGQQCAGYTVAHVRDLLAKRLKLVVGQPFGEFIAADLGLGLSDGFA